MIDILPMVAGNFSIVSIIIGLTQIIKQHVKKAYHSLIPLTLGFVIGCIGWVVDGEAVWVVYGVVAALQASGTWSLTKNAIEKNSGG